ncbi:MAG: hypothetical protein GEV11_05235 [Streptosporangiales bacterium]|nr:hypothetical protein [Streptosporangiales bacterium]
MATLSLGWLVVWFAYLRPPYPSDQLNYLRAALAFPEPLDNPGLAHQYLRFGVTLPARAAIEVFGYSQTAYHLVPLFTTVLLVAAVYVLGVLLYGRVVGAAGALTLVAITPVFLDGSELLPDVLAAALLTAALALAVAVRRGRLRAAWPAYVAIGVLLGWSYLAREFVVCVWPLVPLLLWRRAGLRGLLVVAAPMVLLFAAELVLSALVAGDPLARLKAAAGHGQAPSPPEIAATYRDKPLHVYLLRLPTTLEDFPEAGWLNALLGLTALMGLAGLFLLWRRRKAGPGRPLLPLLLPAAWVASLWVPLTLLGGVLDPSAPKLRLQLIRYWFPIFPAFVLGGLGALALAAAFAVRRSPARGRAATALAAVPVLVMALGTAGTAAAGWARDPGTRAGGATQMERVRTWLAAHPAPAATVWADRRTVGVLGVYRQGPFGGEAWPMRLRTHGPSDRPAAGDLIVVYGAGEPTVCGHCREAAADVFGPALRPAGTAPAYRTPDGQAVVYRVR